MKERTREAKKEIEEEAKREIGRNNTELATKKERLRKKLRG